MAELKDAQVLESAALKQGATPDKVVAPSKVAGNVTSTLFQSDAWVTLHHPPSDYSHHEALLLCEAMPGEWVSWVPGYGEIVLTLDQLS